MTKFADLPKTYDASLVEDRIYEEWESSGAFNPDLLPDRNRKGEPYCIVMPPPNRTGTLHMGHAVMLAIEDLMIRFRRMQGKKALWIPGTDHAAIATQVKVEQLLVKQGMENPRKELGREKFLEKVVEFAEQSHNTIVRQIRKMGSSCDWSREKYTLDEERSRAVNEMFIRMHEDGLIERGFRVVNWDPQFKTTLSDDEVVMKETVAKLLTFKYDKEFPIPIASTRAETKFGDTAVAVHPSDERYKKFIGKIYQPVFCGKTLTIKIVADEAVDPQFGTGAVGVTPAHSMTDAEIAERHQLPMIQVINQDAKMTTEAGVDFAGLTTIEARAKVEQMLEKNGLLIKSEDVSQSLPTAERGEGIVEQLPMRQWFVRVNKPFVLRQDTLIPTLIRGDKGGFRGFRKGQKVTLKELMQEAVTSKQIAIIPEQFEKIYFHWIDHLRDWCISRQIWFGHRIPVWYKSFVIETRSVIARNEAISESKIAASQTPRNDKQEFVVSIQSPGKDWTQDPDTLDTWFSSGLWTFSTLGWPPSAKATGGKPDEDEWPRMRQYHPTAVLETGTDILFFWVARMILMSTYALGEVPFNNVYLHGIVRDEQGRKMSKSLGNTLDPLDLIPKYGTDAVRLSLMIGTAPGQDTKLSEEKIAGFRNFTNKLWNISRFILMQLESDDQKKRRGKTLADEWILARLSVVTNNVTEKIAKEEFSSAGEELRDFTWGDLADWYLEIAKVEKGKEAILTTILETVLALWHPFMPFVTEHIWQTAGFDGHLITHEWPSFKSKTADVSSFEKLRALVTDMRRLRSEQKIEPAKMVEFALIVDKNTKAIAEPNREWIRRLTNAETLTCAEQIDPKWATAASGAVTIGLNVAGAVDAGKERKKIETELKETDAYIASLERKLQNKELIEKAPKNVVDAVKTKKTEAEEKRKALEKRLKEL